MFCCPGCSYVYQILFNDPEGSPTDFKDTDLYRACLAAGVIPKDEKDLVERQSSLLAKEPGVSAAYHEIEEDLSEELTFKIEGMWCTACSCLVEHVVGKINGVLKARVDFLSDFAHIRYLPHRVNPEDVFKRVSKLGYRACLLSHYEQSQENKTLLLRLGVSSILTANIMMISFALYFGFFQDLAKENIVYLSYPLFILATPVVFYGGYPVLQKALAGVRFRKPSMEMLIALGALSSYLYSIVQMLAGSLHLYFDTASMLITLVLLGRYIEARAKAKVSGSVTELYRLANQKVRLLQEGRERWVPATAVESGNEFLILEGERVAVDGRIVLGQGTLDESVLTGESRPSQRSEGDDVMAGALLIRGNLTLKATRVGSDSSLGQMIKLTQQALSTKTPVELLADRITGWFVPIIIVMALATGLILIASHVPADAALLRAVTVLVITCPCALGIATPLAKVAAVAVGRANGILVRDTAAFEKARDIKLLVFDKTGTITEGNFSLLEIVSFGATEQEVLRRVASVEAESEHFLAREILRKAHASPIKLEKVKRFESFSGLGVSGWSESGETFIGNEDFMRTKGLALKGSLKRLTTGHESKGETVVFFAWDDQIQGFLRFGDSIKKDADWVFQELHSRQIVTWLLSGDSQKTTFAVGEMLGVNNVIGKALPGEKARAVRALQEDGYQVGMVGDGINDSAALAQADIGIAAGGGANIIDEASDITIIGGSPAKILDLLDLSKATGRTIRQNLFFAFVYNIIGLPLAVLGFLNPVVAVLAMFASSLTVVGNTLRLSRFGRWENKTGFRSSMAKTS